MKKLTRQDLEEVLSHVVKQGGNQQRVLTTQVFSQADTKGFAKMRRLEKERTLTASTQEFQAQMSFFDPIRGDPGSLA